MGLSIGDRPSFLAASRLAVSTAGSVGLRTSKPGQETTVEGPRLLGQEVPESPQLGFGKNTISFPGVYAETLGSNIRNVRQMFPSLDELQEEARQRIAELREQFGGADPATAKNESDDKARRPVPIEPLFNRAEAENAAASRARSFINGLSQAASAARSRLGQEEPVSLSGVSVRIGGTTSRLGREPGAPTIDIRA